MYAFTSSALLRLFFQGGFAPLPGSGPALGAELSGSSRWRMVSGLTVRSL